MNWHTSSRRKTPLADSFRLESPGPAGAFGYMTMRLIQIMSGLLTPVIAIITTYIAIQQYRSNRAKLRAELYEKRFKVYKATTEYLSKNKGILSEIQQDWHKFDSAIDESPFLFDAELVEWLMAIRKTGQSSGLATLLFHAKFAKGEEEEAMKKYNESREHNVWLNTQQNLS